MDRQPSDDAILGRTWLNEGLAEWASIYARSKLDESSEPWHEFLAGDYERALVLDSYKTSHALEDQGECEASYDDITYYKGCAIFRRTYDLVGEDAFINSLRHYLAQNAYKNVTSEDLWTSFNKISGVDVGAQMRAQIKMPGYPLITITEDSGSSTVTISQKRFLLPSSA